MAAMASYSSSSSYIDKYIDDFQFDEDEKKYEKYVNNVAESGHYLSLNSSSSLNFCSAKSTITNNIVYDEKQLEEKIKIWESYKKVEQPKGLKIKLFPHQLVSVYNMENLEKHRKIKYDNNTFFMTDFGILGDIPGYGKSFSIVSLILRDKMEWNTDKHHDNINLITINQSLKVINKRPIKRVKANLILASSSLVSQWKDYFNYVEKDILKIKEISNKKDFDKLNPNDWDVIIVSSVRYNELMDKFPNISWKRFIFDEAGSTHINAMRHISAGFMWFVSATYSQLLYPGGTSQHFMRYFFGKIGSEYLRYMVIKNDNDFVKYSFKMPEVKEINHVCLNPRILNVLSNFIDSETKTMIAAGNIKGAISRIGGGTTNETNLFEIVSKKQKEKLTQAQASLAFWKNRNNSEKEIESWEKKVKEIEKIIAELEEKYKNILEDDCSICFSTIKEPILIPCCQNLFCGNCVMKWLDTNKSCPMCRTVVNVKELVYVSKKDQFDNSKDESKEEKKQEVSKKLSKQDKVYDIVSKGLEKGGKFLIFSMYDESFYLIRRILDEHKIDFVELSGTKATRDSKIKKFKEGKINVIFLNSRFNGAGINLEEASDIILYHEMPSYIKDQVIGRALRIGRDKDLTIHNLIY
jgi:superfamily II DNA or RNA helicase